ncbi:MAG TPA: glycosyltransferase family 4 protein, partial [Herpetosiphonaceae bacterium]
LHPGDVRRPAAPPPPAIPPQVITVAAPSGQYSRAWREQSWAALADEHGRAPFDLLLSVSAGGQGLISRARRELNLPAVVILHGTIGGDWRTRWRDRRSLRGWYRMGRYAAQVPGQVRRWRAVRADVARWIAVSNEVKADWVREMAVEPALVAVVPNGVDVARFRPDPIGGLAARATVGVPDKAPLLVGVGRLEEEKGFQVAIRALAALGERLPDARLVIAGDGVFRRRLERLIRRLKLAERVTLLGHRPNAELPALLAAADGFVLPSLRHEGFPVVIAEALAAGLPVLASRAGGTPSAIEDGLNGRLLPIGDVQAWAAALAELLGDERRRRAQGALARQIAAARFSEQAMLDATEQVLLAAVEAPWTS